MDKDHHHLTGSRSLQGYTYSPCISSQRSRSCRPSSRSRLPGTCTVCTPGLLDRDRLGSESLGRSRNLLVCKDSPCTFLPASRIRHQGSRSHFPSTCIACIPGWKDKTRQLLVNLGHSRNLLECRSNLCIFHQLSKTHHPNSRSPFPDTGIACILGLQNKVHQGFVSLDHIHSLQGCRSNLCICSHLDRSHCPSSRILSLSICTDYILGLLDKVHLDCQNLGHNHILQEYTNNPCICSHLDKTRHQGSRIPCSDTGIACILGLLDKVHLDLVSLDHNHILQGCRYNPCICSHWDRIRHQDSRNLFQGIDIACTLDSQDKAHQGLANLGHNHIPQGCRNNPCICSHLDKIRRQDNHNPSLNIYIDYTLGLQDKVHLDCQNLDHNHNL